VMETAIKVENLTMYYGKHLAVDHINFEVHVGEVFGFLGPNGAGKTTTQRMLIGVLPPSEGSAWVLDHDMAADPIGAKQHVGVVPEVANPYVELSGWQNMMFAGELYGLARHTRTQRAESLLRDFELWERRSDPARQYSKGMKQRLMLAMALLHQPQVLFLDEPTAGLDVASRRLIHSRVQELARSGTAVFYTTHNIEEANILCDRVAIIREGKLAAIDTPEALKATFSGSQAVEVAFEGPMDPACLEAIASVSRVEKHGDKSWLYTHSPGQVVSALADLARSEATRIVSVNTRGPSLEEVFVRLTESGGSSQ